jgi:hypothetical protein
MSGPRKFTFEKSRAQAEEILQLYETGVEAAEIRTRYNLIPSELWQKIKLARKWRERAKEAAE